MTKVFFRNKETGKRFEVVKVDNVKGELTLRGEHAEFIEPYDKARLKRLGYVLEKE